MSKCGDYHGSCNDNECCNTDNICGTINDENCLNNLNDIYHGKNAIDKLYEKKYDNLLDIHKNSNYILSTDDTCGIDIKNRINKVCPDNKCCSVDNTCRQGNNYCDKKLSLNYDFIKKNNEINIDKYHGKTSKNFPKNNLNINGDCGLGNNGISCETGCCNENNICTDKCYFPSDKDVLQMFDINYDIPKTNEEKKLKKKLINIQYSEPVTYLNELDKYINSLNEEIYTKNKNKIIESKNNKCGINISNKKLFKCPPNKCCDENEECKDVCNKKIDYYNKNIDNNIFDGNTNIDNNNMINIPLVNYSFKNNILNIIFLGLICLIIFIFIILIIFKLSKKLRKRRN
jgi:hypothetical protein